MSKKLTPWFSPQVYPVNIGWYEREWGGDLRKYNDFWNGEYWQNGGEKNMKSPSEAYNNKRWRGLAEKP